MDPLIVTALLADDTQEWLDDLRRRHFPSHRNHLKAHLTLFHALPGNQAEGVAELLRKLTERDKLVVSATEVILLGGGVAYRFRSEDLTAIRQQIAEHFADQMTLQDRNKRDLHVTVQNKVNMDVARKLHSELQAQFEVFETQVRGLGLWRYAGGPWDAIEEALFR